MAILRRLARWATDLDPATIPADVMERARLQHLSVAGALRAAQKAPLAKALRRAATPGSARMLFQGRDTGRRDALRYTASMAAALEYDDYQMGGHTSAGGVAASLALAKGHTLDAVLAATVVANEVAGRLGLSLLISPHHDQAALSVHALASTAAAARLAGLDAAETANAYALALQSARSASHRAMAGPNPGRGLLVGAPALDGLDAVQLAGAGVTGPLDLLDARDGLFAGLAWLPLRAAFTGLGACWLSRTLAFKLMPGSTYLQVPVQGTWEILRRHVKAADKRLRPDQFDRLDIVVGLPAIATEAIANAHPGLTPATIPWSIPRSVGALMMGYGLTAEQLDPAWIADNRDWIAEIARRVHVQHDWRFTARLAEHLLEVAAPLFTGVTVDELRALRPRARGLDLAAPGGEELLEIARLRPDRIAARLGRGSGDLADLDADAWRFTMGCEIKLYTTRGGWWPERRDTPEGAPGWPWADTVARVKDKFAQGDEAARAAADGLMDLPGSSRGLQWVRALEGAA